MNVEDLAALLEMSPMSYCDIEFHDDELQWAPSLRQVNQLAKHLGVTTVELVTGSATDFGERILWPDLVARAKEYLRVTCATQEVLENQVGWKLDDFFASEESMLDNYSVGFLTDLCRVLGIPWVQTLPWSYPGE